MNELHSVAALPSSALPKEKGTTMVATAPHPRPKPIIPTRWLALYIRQVEVLWQLTAVAVIFAPTMLLGPAAWIVVGAAGVALIWELTGRIASTYVELQHPALREDYRGRRLAFVGGLSAAVGFLLLTLVPLAWLGGDLEASVAWVLVGFGILGGWFTWHVFRQGWWPGYAIPALVLMAVAGGVGIVTVVAHPAPVNLSYLVLWARLMALFALVAVTTLWAQPIGEKTNWPRRLLHGAIVIPILASVLSVLLGSLTPANGARVELPLLWIAGWLLGLIVLGFVWGRQWVRTRSELVPLARRLWRGNANPMEIRLPLLMMAVPALMLAPVASTGQFAICLGAYALFALTRGWSDRRGSFTAKKTLSAAPISSLNPR